MEKNEKPEGNLDEQVHQLEPEQAETLDTQDLSLDPDSDYLDTLKDDPEALLKEAKKFRAVAKRGEKKPKEDAPAAPAEKGTFVTEEKFQKINRDKAIRLATTASETDPDDLKSLKTDIADNWDQVKTYFVSRRGQDNAEDVYEDIIDAYNVFRARNPKATGDNPAVELQKSALIKGASGGPQGTLPTKKSTLNIPKKNTPDTWYSPKK